MFKRSSSPVYAVCYFGKDDTMAVIRHLGHCSTYYGECNIVAVRRFGNMFLKHEHTGIPDLGPMAHDKQHGAPAVSPQAGRQCAYGNLVDYIFVLGATPRHKIFPCAQTIRSHITLSLRHGPATLERLDTRLSEEYHKLKSSRTGQNQNIWVRGK